MAGDYSVSGPRLCLLVKWSVMKKCRPLPSHTVEVWHNGTRHQGEYTVKNGVVVVTYGKATMPGLIGNQTAETIASVLLREILDGNNWRF